MEYIVPFVISLAVFGVLSFAYIAVGAVGGGFGGTGNNKARKLSGLIIAAAVIYAIFLFLLTSAAFIKASVAAACVVAVFWMVQR